MHPAINRTAPPELQRAGAPMDHVPVDPAARIFGPHSTARYRTLLTSMLAKGHGIEALCLFLSLTRDALIEIVVHLDLPTPHDRPLRKSSGRRAWRADEFPIFVTGWLENWSAACLADRFGRSKGSIWSKARKMGLPKRERRALFWPEADQGPTVTETEVVAEREGERPRKRLPERWLVKGTDRLLELTSQRNGLEVAWADNIEALVELGWRHWSGQRLASIARDYGISYRAVASQLHWLDSKAPRSRAERSDLFDRTLGEANAKKAGYKLAYSKSDSRFPYFSRKHSRSRRDDKVGFYNVAFV